MTALGTSILNAWSTNNSVTILLVENLPAAMWDAAIPGTRRKTVRALAAHMHNARRGWINTLGMPHGVEVPAAVDRLHVTRARLVAALKQSGRGIAALLMLALDNDGSIPPTRKYVWRNLPLDAGHVLAYFVAHEGHHRGQLIMLARQLGHELPAEVTNGVWNWTKLMPR